MPRGCVDRLTLIAVAEQRCPPSKFRHIRRHLPKCPRWQAQVVRAAEGRLGDTIEEEPRRPWRRRRAYSTALAEANVNLQKAMRLAGHRSPLTHMRYVDRVKALKAPEAAVNLRTQKASGMPFESSGEEG